MWMIMLSFAIIENYMKHRL